MRWCCLPRLPGYGHPGQGERFLAPATWFISLRASGPKARGEIGGWFQPAEMPVGTAGVSNNPASWIDFFFSFRAPCHLRRIFQFPAPFFLILFIYGFVYQRRIYAMTACQRKMQDEIVHD